MSCYHPHRAIMDLCTDDNGLKKWSVHFNCSSYKPVSDFWRYVDIPCGKCIGCRLDYSRQWAARCMLEAGYYEFNWFLTLTYDDEHIPETFGKWPKSGKFDYKTGEFVAEEGKEIEFKDVSSLRPKDLTDFLKRLRMRWLRNYGLDNIRYYACGEYGDRNGRPHYHLIIFNLPLFDLKQSSKFSQRRGSPPLFESKELSDVWGKGLVAVGEVNIKTAGYVSRYVTKKHKVNSSEYYFKLGLVPPFTRMSRKPGIGYHYYRDNFEKIYSDDCFYLTDGEGHAQKYKPGRYFDKCFESEHPLLMSYIKSLRSEMSDQQLQSLLRSISIPYSDYLKVQEQNKLLKLKSLKRPL